MFGRCLKTKVFLAALSMIVPLSLFMAFLGFQIVKRNLLAAGAPACSVSAGQLVPLLLFLAAADAGLALIISLVVAACFSRPLANLRQAAGRLAGGELGHQADPQTGLAELDRLAEDFNKMSARLDERDKNLSIANSKLALLNKNYVDLIDFVSHEIKGILATVVMNVCAVHDEFFGALNEKQKRALHSAAQSLDYLTLTVRKFLNLGKIEKGELKVNKTEAKLSEDIFGRAISPLLPSAARKGMSIQNNIAANLRAFIDPELMQIAAGNLIANAVKYGNEGSEIVISSRQCDGKIGLEVYNDSIPLTAAQQAQLFKRFSRLDTAATRFEKGTGLGLFITKEIIQMHGGKIWTEARAKGNAFIFELANQQK